MGPVHEFPPLSVTPRELSAESFQVHPFRWQRGVKQRADERHRRPVVVVIDVVEDQIRCDEVAIGTEHADDTRAEIVDRPVGPTDPLLEG